MSINIEQLIKINSNVLSNSATYRSLNGLFLVDNNFIPTSQRVLNFVDATQVGKFFGYDSKEYYYSTIYFKGANKYTKTPGGLMFGRYVKTKTASEVIGGVLLLPLSKLKLLTSSSLTIVLNGDQYDSGIVNLSTATSLSDIATKLTTALNTENPTLSTYNIALTYNAIRKGYFLTASNTALEAEFDYCVDSDLSNALCLTKKTGAYLSNSIVAQTPAENMDSLISFNRGFACFTSYVESLTETELYDLASWANLAKNYAFIVGSNDLTVLDPLNFDNLFGEISVAEFESVIMNYSQYNEQNYLDLNAAVAGWGACVNYKEQAGTGSYAYSSQNGLLTTVKDSDKALVLTTKNINFYGEYSENEDVESYNFYENGKITGTSLFADNFMNNLWLKSSITNNVAANFKITKKFSFTDTGYGQLRAPILKSITDAVYNGVIEPGVIIGEAISKELAKSIGRDISNDLYNNGYYLELLVAGDEERANRTLYVNLIYTNGGAIQRVIINLTQVI